MTRSVEEARGIVTLEGNQERVSQIRLRRCVPDPDGETAVGLEGRANVPTIESVWGPRFAVGRFFVSNHANARRGKGRAVEVKVAMEVGPGGQVGV
jgi:hypothetical protein